MRQRCVLAAQALQETICAALEAADGQARFQESHWQREGGGGGRTRVLEGGRLLEKAGVNFSAVHGALPAALVAEMPGEDATFFATGISLVLHPRNPHVPTVHANFRYIERGASWWLGGGADLTPYVLYEADARHFHQTLKDACDRHDPDFYPRFKSWCDRYFHIKHRGETRGVGGLFFDHLTPDAAHTPESLVAFWEDAGRAFLPAYLPIAERRADTPYDEALRTWQLQRRGRYVEFNLVYDRGTRFGLETDGRIESILMSLPPLVRWDYDPQVAPDSPEAALLAVLRQPRDWASP
ncbi:MAG: oxygen-dependent coproporphyrinogen oxidase [Myxococcota bacterium]